jgi:RimJ/RimL family protein N-acetyltransferase
MEDCGLVWEWANDPTIRAASFSSDSIPWQQHLAWFTSKLADPNCVLYIALVDDNRVGQVRYQLEGREATISVSLAPEWRRRGYGSAVIWHASRLVLETTDASRIIAYLRPENTVSVQAFARAGFRPNGAATVQGQAALCFVLEKDLTS